MDTPSTWKARTLRGFIVENLGELVIIVGAEGFLSLVLELNLMFLRRLIIEKSIDLTASTLETSEAIIWKMVDIFHEKKVLSQWKLL